ncbi:MAG: Ig-like domain-containing protein, partial [Deltaproteobacteria bacterium]|nr:Ig-like domain-containing protein [Deltaproteobacteria bacterium]
LLGGCGGGGGGGGTAIVPELPATFEVMSVVPSDNQAGIPVGGTIQVTFNQAVDPTTVGSGINASSFIGGLPGSVAYNSSTNTATFTPGTQLAPLTEYTLTVSTSVRSAAGDPLSAPYTLRFTTESAFWAYDFIQDNSYLVPAQKVGEGDHCYIYVESGRTVAEANVDALIAQFDDAIYHNIVDNFGSEPNPGADGLAKIFILLLDIRDGYTPGGGYIAGYFYGINEESNVDVYPYGYRSNQKEIFFMDIDPGNPASSTFYKTLAHEFQHMVHWEQKGYSDDTWLDEAMSEIAPYYAGYGANYSRVYTFESGTNRSDSLTAWGGELKDYAVAYMWSQYMVDRFPDNVFKSILSNPFYGIASVNDYLGSLDPPLSFSSVFRDWSIAVFSGNAMTWPGHPEWAYATINTWPGTYGGITLPGLLTSGNRNQAALPALSGWGIDLYWYTSLSGSPALTWTAGGSPAPQASFYDWDTGGALTFDMVSGTPYPYDNAAVLILQNAGGSATASSSTTNPAILDAPSTVLSPAAKLMAVSEDHASGSLMEATGEPIPVCMHDHLSRKGKEVRRMVREHRNAR